MQIRSPRILLRALSPEDGEVLHALAKNSLTMGSTTTFWRPWSPEDFKRFSAPNLSGMPESIRLGICPMENGEERLIGVIELNRISWIHGNAEVGITILSDQDQKKGFGKEALSLLCDWSFKVLRLRRLYAKIFDSNEESKRCFEKIGFEREGVWREHCFVDGRGMDCVLFGLLKEPNGGSAE